MKKQFPSSKGCSGPALFKADVGGEFMKLAERVFNTVEERASRTLDTFKELAPEMQPTQSDLRRILGRAAQGAFSDALDVKTLASISSKLTGDLPCSGRELRRRVEGAPSRRIDEVVCLLALYGFRNGLVDGDLGLLGGSDVTFQFQLSRDLGKVRLASMTLNQRASARDVFLFTQTSTPSLQVRANELRRTSSDDDNELLITIITLGLPLLFECLKELIKLIKKALESGDEDKIEEAIDDVKEAIEDLEEEIEDLDDDIEELEEDIEDEEDPEDKKDLEKELEEKKKEKRNKEKAKDHLEEAQDSLEDAQRDLRR